MRVRGLLVCMATLAALAGCDPDSNGGAAPEPSAAASATRPAVPEGWRWESYRDVAVAVPGDWGYSGYGRWSAWCADGGSRKAAIGRPGAVPDILCWDPKKGGVDPGSLVANTGAFVAFALTSDLDLPEEGDRRIVRAGAAGVVIQAPLALREQIAETVHAIEGADFNRCPLSHPVSADAAHRPAVVDQATVTGTDSISLCKYPLPRQPGSPVPGPALVSSRQVDGAEAGRAIAAILAAPAGGGPNRIDPAECSLDYGYGNEVLVVRIQRAGLDPAEILVHYSGCAHNGFDDGQTVRTLTAEGLATMVAGPLAPTSYIGDRGMPELIARARTLAASAART